VLLCLTNCLAADPPEHRSPDPAIRNNSLALLTDLLNDEKHVDKLLIIKRDSPELKHLVKDISETAGDGAKRLEKLMKRDPALRKDTDLPPGEQATRKAVSKTKERLLLHSHDAEFEFQLLLTQAEALNYGAHLAQVASENEPRPELAREFSDLSSQLQQLHEQVIERLRFKTSPR
jgi:hypothetical protein